MVGTVLGRLEGQVCCEAGWSAQQETPPGQRSGGRQAGPKAAEDLTDGPGHRLDADQQAVHTVPDWQLQGGRLPQDPAR